MTLDRVALVRLHDLLAAPDPVDLVGRGHRLACEGHPERRQRVLLPLLTVWAQRRCLAVDPDPVLAPATRSLRLLRRRA